MMSEEPTPNQTKYDAIAELAYKCMIGEEGYEYMLKEYLTRLNKNPFQNSNYRDRLNFCFWMKICLT